MIRKPIKISRLLFLLEKVCYDDQFGDFDVKEAIVLLIELEIIDKSKIYFDVKCENDDLV